MKRSTTKTTRLELGVLFGALLNLAATPIASAAPSLAFFDKGAKLVDITTAGDSGKTRAGATVGITAQNPETIAGQNVIKVTVALTNGDKSQALYSGLITQDGDGSYQGALKGTAGSYVSIVDLLVTGGGQNGGAGGADSAGGEGGDSSGKNGNSNGSGDGGNFAGGGWGKFGDSGKNGGGSDKGDGVRPAVMPQRDLIVRLCGADFVEMTDKDNPPFDQLTKVFWRDAAWQGELNALLSDIETSKKNSGSIDQALVKRTLEALAKLPIATHTSVSATRNSQDQQVSELTKGNGSSLILRSFAIIYPELVTYLDRAARTSNAVASVSGLSFEAKDVAKVLGLLGGLDSEWAVEPGNTKRRDEINALLANPEESRQHKQAVIATVLAVWFSASMTDEKEMALYLGFADTYLNTVGAGSVATVAGVQGWVKNTLHLVAPRYTQTQDSQWQAQRDLLNTNIKDAQDTWIAYLKREVLDPERFVAFKARFGDYAEDLRDLSQALVDYSTDEKKKIEIFVRIASSLAGKDGLPPSWPIQRWVTEFFKENEALCMEDSGDTPQDAEAADFALNLIRLFLAV